MEISSIKQEEIIKEIQEELKGAEYEGRKNNRVVILIQGLLDLYTHKKGRVEELKQELLEEKEKNKELENKLNQMYNEQQIYDLDEINRSHISFN